MEWKRVIRKEQKQTPGGVLYVDTLVGWECSTPACRNTRWSRPGEDRRPSDQCELCCPER
jgi:hypothetical protein